MKSEGRPLKRGRPFGSFSRRVLQRLNNGAVHIEHEKTAQGEREDLREGEGQPGGGEAHEMSQKPSGGENEHQLPQDGDDQTQNAVAQSLTHGGGDNAEGGEGEAQADEPQGFKGA